MSSILATVDNIGQRIVGVFVYSIHVLATIYLSFRAAFFDQAQGWRTVVNVVSMQIYFTGIQALPIVSVLALASGGLVIMQSSLQLSMLGGTSMIGDLLVAITVRELSPLLTALIVIARSGTAVASDVGMMRVNKEIEALEAMGVNPLSYIIFPRLAGGIVSVVCLGFYFNVIALLGGFLVSRFVQNLPFHYYVDALSNAITFGDFILFLTKNTFSGAIIFTVCSYQGLLVKGSPTEVPQVTTKAVMNSMIYVIAFNFAVTLLFYLDRLARMGLI